MPIPPLVPMAQEKRASFTQPMLFLSAFMPEKLHWEYEIELDGYRAVAFTTGGRVQLRSRNDNDVCCSIRGYRRSAAPDAERNDHRWRDRKTFIANPEEQFMCWTHRDKMLESVVERTRRDDFSCE